MRIALVSPASLLGVLVRSLNEISDPSRVIGIADVENLHPGVKERDDEELAVIGSIDPSRHLMGTEACSFGAEISRELADGRGRNRPRREFVADVDDARILPFLRSAVVRGLFRETDG